MLYSLSVEGTPQKQMREWLSGGASPCQGEGRGFESRLALEKQEKAVSNDTVFFIDVYEKNRYNHE